MVNCGQLTAKFLAWVYSSGKRENRIKGKRRKETGFDRASASLSHGTTKETKKIK